MAVVNFNFNQIVAERNKPTSGKINIGTNISITDVIEHPLNIPDDKQKAVRFGFKFSAVYEPDVGRITLSGEVIHIFEAKLADEILAEYKKGKKVKKEILPIIYSFVLTKCHVEAIAVSRDVNLPPPIPMPKIQQKEKA